MTKDGRHVTTEEGEEEEKDFAQTTMSTAWEPSPLRRFETARVEAD